MRVIPTFKGDDWEVVCLEVTRVGLEDGWGLGQEERLQSGAQA